MDKNIQHLMEMKVVLESMYQLKVNEPEQYEMRVKTLCKARRLILKKLIEIKELEMLK